MDMNRKLKLLVLGSITLSAIIMTQAVYADGGTLPKITLDQFMETWGDRKIQPERAEPEGTYDLKARILRAGKPVGTEEHIKEKECVIVQELWPANTKRFLIRPIKCKGSNKSGMIPNQYIVATQILDNLYEADGVLIKAPKHGAPTEHSIKIYVNARDNANSNLPIDILITVDDHAANGGGGGAHPGHGNYK